MAAFSFIDLFAGIGGFHRALASLGGKCVFASEIDKFCRIVYLENYDMEPAGDIRKIDASDIPDHDVLTAGFPCQPFSIAGVSKYNSLGYQHGFRNETKGTLFFEIARIIEARRPAAFILENVKHLVRHDRGNTFKVILRTLKEELGYHVYYRIIDAVHFVPQHRERIFIVGFREQVDFSWLPLPEQRKIRLKDILEKNVDPRYTLSDHLWNYLREYAQRHRQKGNGFGYGLVDPDDDDAVTRTLSARYYKDGSEILIYQGEGKNPRRLTPRECARLMGFPDTHVINVSDTQAYKQFGNAVVVPVARFVAEAVLRAMGIVKNANDSGTVESNDERRMEKQLSFVFDS